MSSIKPIFLFLFSREYPKLTLAECQALHPEGKEWTHTKNYALSKITTLKETHLACTKKVFKIYFQGNLKEVEEFVQIHAQKIKESVSFQKLCLNQDGKNTITSTKARKLLFTFTKKPSINLNNPERKFVLLYEKNKYFIAEEVWENKEKFSKRRNHLLPSPHPTSLQPKLARAFINLLNPDTDDVILDPFCGSGGILIESRLMNFKTIGIDIDADMIRRAKNNLSSLNIEAKLYKGDATKDLCEADCIVTDLPYGKNSKNLNLEETYKDFLLLAAKCTKKMLLACPHSVNMKILLDTSPWKIEKEFSLPLNKSLTKKVFALSLED